MQEQYGFIYEALAEALYVRAKPIKQEEFEKIFMSMSKQETESGKSGLAKQYDVSSSSLASLNQTLSGAYHFLMGPSSVILRRQSTPSTSPSTSKVSFTLSSNFFYKHHFEVILYETDLVSTLVDVSAELSVFEIHIELP